MEFETWDSWQHIAILEVRVVKSTVMEVMPRSPQFNDIGNIIINQ